MAAVALRFAFVDFYVGQKNKTIMIFEFFVLSIACLEVFKVCTQANFQLQNDKQRIQYLLFKQRIT